MPINTNEARANLVRSNKEVKPELRKLGKALANATPAQRQELLKQITQVARGVGGGRKSTLGEGTKGSSGPRGRKLKQYMVLRINTVADSTKNPNAQTALKLAQIYNKANAGELEVFNYPQEHEALVALMNKILASRGEKVTPTRVQLRALEKWVRFV